MVASLPPHRNRPFRQTPPHDNTYGFRWPISCVCVKLDARVPHSQRYTFQRCAFSSPLVPKLEARDEAVGGRSCGLKGLSTRILRLNGSVIIRVCVCVYIALCLHITSVRKFITRAHNTNEQRVNTYVLHTYALGYVWHELKYRRPLCGWACWWEWDGVCVSVSVCVCVCVITFRGADGRTCSIEYDMNGVVSHSLTHSTYWNCLLGCGVCIKRDDNRLSLSCQHICISM